jgi:ketosteroid isomerase-like protein
MRKLATAAVVLTLGLWACGPRLIPGTNIDDTEDNKAIMQVVADYKNAYERRDAAAVLKLVAPSFYETNGTADTSDDYDYKGLSQVLQKEFGQIQDNALNIDVRNISVKGDEAEVNYYYSERFQLADAGANGGFKGSSDVAQIKLHRENGTWKIVSGI